MKLVSIQVIPAIRGLKIDTLKCISRLTCAFLCLVFSNNSDGGTVSASLLE